MARHAKQVYGVEVVEPAVRDARANAARNHIENVTFEVGKAEDVIQTLEGRRTCPWMSSWSIRRAKDLDKTFHRRGRVYEAAKDRLRLLQPRDPGARLAAASRLWLHSQRKPSRWTCSRRRSILRVLRLWRWRSKTAQLSWRNSKRHRTSIDCCGCLFLTVAGMNIC